MSEVTSRPSNENPSALPLGTRLGEFELKSLLGIGGFGIVYLAFDHALEREVAVKEYMPASLAGRTETMHVSIRSQSDAEVFALGLKSFVNEARLLARFDHPSLLKVHRFWEGNGTAYMAMPVMRGRTVKEVRLEMQQPPDEAWMRAVLDPLLGAIEKLHSEGVYHRDIAPDNIQIEPDGHPVLLDFGAARRVLSDKSQALTAILKPAYAPIEQYAEAGSVKQGPWTDIYALGATLHFLLLGRPPPPATARAIHDDVSALTTQALPGCSENFLHIVDWMLAPRPADRPQSVSALREVLEGRVPTPIRRIAAQDRASDWDRTVILPTPASARTQVTSAPPAKAVTGIDFDATVMLPSATQAAAAAARSAAAAEAPTPIAAPPLPTPVAAAPVPMPAKSRALPIGLGVGVLVLALAAVALWPRKPAPVAESVLAPPPAAAEVASAALPAPSVPESAVATVVVPAVTPSVSSSADAPSRAAALGAPASSSTAPAVVAAPAKTPAKSSASASRAAAAAALPAPAPPTVASTPAPQPEPVKPKIEPAPAPAPLPAFAAAASKAGAAGPEVVCGGRNPLAYFVCMEKECLKGEQSGSADCRKWHKNARSQE